MAGEELIVSSPYDGSEVGRVPEQGADDVDAAVAAARATLADPPPAWRRAEVLDRVAVALREREDDLARTIAAEAAKPIRTARVEAQRAVSTFTFAAVAARTLAGDVVPIEAADNGEGKLAFTLRLPVGVIGAITPFNFPLNLVAHKVAPAIAAGCPIVVKPAGQTPLSALLLQEIVHGAGLEPERFAVVTGPGATVGDRLVTHDDVAMLTFTGSGTVGWSIREKAPRKRVSLELGNNAPLVVHADGDWETAATKVKVAGYSHAGQSCISTQRIYVHRSIHDAFVQALTDHVRSLVVGDPMDEATDVSALISTDDTERVRTWVEEAAAAGADVRVGGGVDGRLLEPTVLTGMEPGMKVSVEEVFGPVVGVRAYDDVDEAFALANDTRYGLQAAIFTRDIGLALRAGRTLEFGGVLVNEVPTFRADQMPYGGVRDSGNTKEGPTYAVREMTEERLVVVQA
jgi:acyl-CoA reductase-like NAD-dependent aldehyde dehydrogenase